MGWQNTEFLEVSHIWLWSFRDVLHIFSCGRALLLPKVFFCLHIVLLNVIPSLPQKSLPSPTLSPPHMVLTTTLRLFPVPSLPLR